MKNYHNNHTMTAAVCRKGKILHIGNSNKFIGPKINWNNQRRMLTTHAEASAHKKLSNEQIIKNKNKLTMIVIQTNSLGELKNSCPCIHCLHTILIKNNYKNCIFIQNQKFYKMTISELVNNNICKMSLGERLFCKECS